MRELAHAKCPLCKRNRLYLPFKEGKTYHCGSCRERFIIFEKEIIFRQEYEYYAKHKTIRGMKYIESMKVDRKTEEKTYYNKGDLEKLF
ncbi:MAG: hypothetical protein HOF38_05975 [Elusimicrobiaceae bacterium]|jgi:hypothetical protein|nr:hypothetical protein [Elusimicrobiaceae bacterium]MBT3955682.1 hypothetical protein [Elusimicrobiaceae bacterium]MBT4008264.1 hypothetical protein [Elusimicrobiaceae bacterium]MBT4402349.1 hypothetical protein [Elusimicrobiaceae bacterium]MBT4439794.1 hypothetical protein [Elusimicrobiaceae bacterium]